MKFCKSTLKSRLGLPSLLESSHIKMAEIGVYKGYYAKQLLEIYQNDIEKLYLIDPWSSPECEGQMIGNQQDYLELFEDLKDKPVELIKEYSQQAVRRFESGENATLDLVYLDGEHTYDGVFADIELWYHKVKKGGILAGHDIFAPEHIGVTQAVMDQFEAVVFVIPTETCPFTNNTVNSTWYIVKQS